MGAPRLTSPSSDPDPVPVFVRMFQVQEVLGVSDDTVLRWEKQGLIRVYRRGRISSVRTEDVIRVMGG